MNQTRDTKAPTLPSPIINTPKNNDKYPSKKIPISGSSVLKSPAKVWVYFHEGWWEPNSQFEINEDGTWGGELDWKFAMPYGTNSIVARHEQGLEYSEDSAPVTFTVELPTVVITHPEQGGSVGQTAAFKGTGEPGAEVTVVMADDESKVLGTGTVYSTYEWQVGNGDVVLQPGKTCVKANSRSSGETSPWTEPLCFFVKPFQPVIQSPPAGDVTSSIEVKGVGYQGASMEVWLIGNPRVSLGKVDVDKDMGWKIPIQLPAGECEIEAIQTYQEAVSDPSPPRKFSVK